MIFEFRVPIISALFDPRLRVSPHFNFISFEVQMDLEAAGGLMTSTCYSWEGFETKIVATAASINTTTSFDLQ